MLSEELLRKVRLMEITSRKRVDDVLTGNYKSHFKGQGVQFSEHRLYVPGDDVRHINWKATARTKEPLVKIYDEEREVSVFLVVDVSASETFGSNEKLKSEVLAEIGGMLAHAVSHTGDKVGVLFFAGTVEHIIPPKKGRQHVLRIIRDLLTYEPKSRGTALAEALDAAGRVMKHRGIVFVLSDFISEGYGVALKRLARRHDVVAVSIGDERERSIPELGQILFFDPETEKEHWVDTASYAFQKWHQEYQKKFEEQTQVVLRGAGVEMLKILTKEDYGEAVVRFFRSRSRQRR